VASVKYVVHKVGCPVVWDQRVEQQLNVLVKLREATVRFYCQGCAGASEWERVELPSEERLLEWPA
jgi:hypothetical protein